MAVAAILVRSHQISTADVILFCVIVPSIILHEISHGWVALAFGDDTAKRAGRLTLNPIAHIDPIGTIVVPALMALSGLGMFGWAKPVPVNVGRLRHPRNETVVVSLAGPATNLLLAALAAVVFKVFGGAGTVTQQGTFGAVWAEVALLPRAGQHLAGRLQPDPDPAARRLGALRAAAAPGLVAGLPADPAVHHAAVAWCCSCSTSTCTPDRSTWLFDHLFNWWATLLGV